jgi:hypothetical protein
MDSLLSFPVGLFHPLQHAGLSRRSPVCRQTADNDTLPSQNPSLTLKTSRMAELAGCAQEVLDFEEVGLSIKTN